MYLRVHHILTLLLFIQPINQRFDQISSKRYDSWICWWVFLWEGDLERPKEYNWGRFPNCGGVVRSPTLNCSGKQTRFWPFICSSAFFRLFDGLLILRAESNFTTTAPNEIKYLWVFLNSYMRWDIQIRYVFRKLRTILYWLKLLKKYLHCRV